MINEPLHGRPHTCREPCLPVIVIGVFLRLTSNVYTSPFITLSVLCDFPKNCGERWPAYIQIRYSRVFLTHPLIFVIACVFIRITERISNEHCHRFCRESDFKMYSWTLSLSAVIWSSFVSYFDHLYSQKW